MRESEHLDINLGNTCTASNLALNQPGTFENLNMFRGCSKRNVKMLCELAHAVRPLKQQLDNRPASLVRKRPEQTIKARPRIFNHLGYY